jgi:hypothetical protein
LKVIEVLMPTNNLDAPREVLASLDDTSAALQAIKNHARSGQNTNALRAMFIPTDVRSTPSAVPAAATPVQSPRAKAAIVAPGP